MMQGLYPPPWQLFRLKLYGLCSWGMFVSYLYLEESIESPARSGIGPARSDMGPARPNLGFRLPCRVQMASKFGGMQPLQCPRAFIMAWIRGVMEPSPSYTFGVWGALPSDVRTSAARCRRDSSNCNRS